MQRRWRVVASRPAALLMTVTDAASDSNEPISQTSKRIAIIFPTFTQLKRHFQFLGGLTTFIPQSKKTQQHNNNKKLIKKKNGKTVANS